MTDQVYLNIIIYAVTTQACRAVMAGYYAFFKK